MPLSDLLAKYVTRLHRAVFDVSRGKVGGSLGKMPVLKLTTVGRRSGQERVTMLSTPVHDENRVVLVASKAGADEHPSWYVNLRANPQVKLTFAGRTRDMLARTASAQEKAELWPQIVAAYPGYGGYQVKTSRDIPVVICEKVG